MSQQLARNPALPADSVPASQVPADTVRNGTKPLDREGRAFDAAVGEAYWGAGLMGPQLAELAGAAQRSQSQLLASAVSHLQTIDLERLMAHSFVRHARNYLDMFRFPEPQATPPLTDRGPALERLRWPAGAGRGGVALYVDVPFCETACAFCTTQGRNTHGDRRPVLRYLAALEREMQLLSDRFAGGVPPIACLYVGGGTGSYLELDEVDRLLDMLRRHFGMSASIPMTMEGSPASLTGAKAKGLYQRGFDAVSLGVESFEDQLLQTCRRAHDSQMARDRVAEVQEAGIAHVNIDLICGLPGQRMVDFLRTLQTVAEVQPGAVTLYAQRVHRRTRFWQLDDRRFPAITIVYLMQAVARIMLTSMGYQRSENNRYVRDPSFRHAQNFFTRSGGYDLGVGTRAQSQVDDLCWRNSHIQRDYFKAIGEGVLPLTHFTQVTQAVHRLKHFLLPLKLAPGLSAHTFRERTGADLQVEYGDLLQELGDFGLLQKTEEGYRPTEAGLLLETEMLRWVQRRVREREAQAAKP